MNLREHIAEAQRKKIAIGHFNVSTVDGIWAVADAALELKVPVIIGVSEGERDYIGVKQAVAIVRSIREERSQDIFLNADHTYSLARVEEAINAGYDSVIFDGAQLSLEENIEMTKKCVEYAKNRSAIDNRDILVEGELGFIGKSSKVLDSIPDGAVVGDDQMTKPDDAARFVHETNVDLLAPAVGNIHGMIRGGDPALNTALVGKICSGTGIPVVLHGASGNSSDDIKKAIEAGAAIVHINTELRVAYRAALVKSLSGDPEEVSPYKYLKPAKIAMQKVVMEKLKIFNSL